MSQVLQGLVAVPGVFGCAVFDGSGQCTAHELSPPYEPVLLAQLLDSFRATFEIFESSDDDGPVRELVLECENGMFVVRRVGDATVLVINQLTTNLAMLNVALNVVAAKFAKSGAGAGAVAGAPLSTMSNPMSGLGARSGSGSMTGGSWASSTSGGPIPPDAVGRPAVMRLLKVLQKYLGPAAKPVLKQEMRAFGVGSSTLRKSQGADLVQSLSRRITQPDWRTKFLDEAGDLFN